MNQDLENQLIAILTEKNVKLQEPMKQHTTFKIGGAADYFVTPDTTEQLKQVILLCRKGNIPYYVIGNGSNLLVADKGYRGVIIRLCRNLDRLTIMDSADAGNTEHRIKAGAGIMLSRLASEAAGMGYTGLEFAGGIPGTLGGAVTMNAGAYGGEIKDCIESVSVMNEQGDITVLSKDELLLGYRTSVIQKKNLIVLEAVFVFETGDREQIKEKMAEYNRLRRQKQPLEYPSAGSTFKRPEGYFAGKLIMDAGLGGFRVGGIMVSGKHCGFVVNTGDGTASEARQLIKEVDRIVYDRFQVHLEPEVRFLGEFE